MATSPIILVVFFLIEHFIALFSLMGYFLYRMAWNIPVVVLRFTGDKRRPMIFLTRARKWTYGGVNSLKIKGYKLAFRDFEAENYYPSPRGKFGGLILWEFKPGWLTPTLPQKEMKSLPKKEQKRLEHIFGELKNSNLLPVDFKFDKDIYKSLMLKSIDDVDVEWYLRQNQRIELQYTGGLKEFLMRYGGHITLVFVSMTILVITVVGLQKAPEIAAACAGAATEVAKETVLKDIATSTGPPG